MFKYTLQISIWIKGTLMYTISGLDITNKASEHNSTQFEHAPVQATSECTVHFPSCTLSTTECTSYKTTSYLSTHNNYKSSEVSIPHM